MKLVCAWYNDSRLLMKLEKDSKGYNLDGIPIPSELAKRLCGLNYDNAIKLLKSCKI